MHFTGRSYELLQLTRLLTDVEQGSTRVAIEGLAGLGKTELALQLVDQLAHEGRFPGGIFWIDAEDPDLAGTLGSVIADQWRLSMP